MSCCFGESYVAPIFFDRTVITEEYHGTSKQLCAQFTDHERDNFLFVKDGVTCHTDTD